MQVRLGIDIGGTFTDLVAQANSGEAWRVKVASRPTRPAEGAIGSVKRFLDDYDVNPKTVSLVVHATTLASNALLTRRPPPVALVTTSGFRDVLEIGRQNRPELYNLQVERIPPLVPRRFRFEVAERITHEGKVLLPINIAQARRVARQIRGLGIRSVAVCFLHSYANPCHESEMATVLRREIPRVLLSVSSELLPEFREYERTSTTVVNACLQPLISDYMSSLQKGLVSLGISAPLFVMQSNGGTIISDQAVRQPARIIESGPVAGAVASRFYGGKAGAEAVISLDVGGTTSKAGVWMGRHFDVTGEYEVGGRMHGIRRIEGSGYPVGFPYVDLVEIGTGGGSIAHVDEAGVLHVGPESAGAEPGPACYNRGGGRPTLTDANLVLGRLNPDHLLGGELKIDLDRANDAIENRIASRMKTSVVQASAGVLKIALANIAGALKAASVERGHDPRGMTLVPFGGAGPMHACEVAEELMIRRVLVPPWAGLFSSLGLLLSDLLHDYVRTVLVGEDDVDVQSLRKMFEELEGRGRTLLKAEGVESDEMECERMLDMRYRGQSYELSVPVPGRGVDGRLIRAMTDFHDVHMRRYGYLDRERKVEIVNIRVNCRGKTRKQLLRVKRRSGRIVPRSRRRVLIRGRFVDKCPVFDRDNFGPGFKGRGPCVVEDYDSTMILTPGSRFEVDNSGCVRVTLTS